MVFFSVFLALQAPHHPRHTRDFTVGTLPIAPNLLHTQHPFHRKAMLRSVAGIASPHQRRPHRHQPSTNRSWRYSLPCTNRLTATTISSSSRVFPLCAPPHLASRISHISRSLCGGHPTEQQTRSLLLLCQTDERRGALPRVFVRDRADPNSGQLLKFQSF